ncbi:unnamed protein product [Cuscuta epithymum]|uniref:DUF4378 domain-containing protein n=1 Tax=Cuscuta epithymum TaxID=186058 RepID=A0AAV0E412_9ASTE|nr:unnamed protein product [Cuscuta epithymum]
MKPKLAKPMTPFLLKDYLGDEMSSCSSNGFRSYPRRECSTTVRFLLEADLKDAPARDPVSEAPPARGRAAANKAPKARVFSALQRASKKVIKAVRTLQIASSPAAVKSEKQSEPKKEIPTANFPRKLLKRNLNIKLTDRSEMERWKVYDQLMENMCKPSDSNSSTSNSWCDSDFMASGSLLQSSSCDSEVSSRVGHNDVVAAKTSLAEKAVSNESVGVTNAYPPTKQLWSITTCNVEKEQSSPISTLDCPFEDEDDVSFQDKLNIGPETLRKLMKKIKRFESLTQIEVPLKAESPLCNSLSFTPYNFRDIGCEDHSQVELKAALLLQQLNHNRRLSSCSLKLNVTERFLLLDFFRDGIIEDRLPVSQLIKEAEDWINGESHRYLHEWEVEKNRKRYIEDMENEWELKRIVDEENGGLAMELEKYVLSSLVNELVVDLACLSKQRIIKDGLSSYHRS